MEFSPLTAETYAECAAPILAILLEVFPFPSDRQVENSAQEFARRKGISATDVGAEPDAEIGRFVRGSLSLASITPTLIAVMATVASLHNVTMLTIALFCILAALVVANAVVGGLHPEDYETDIVVAGQLYTGVTHARLVSWFIRIANVMLVALILLHAAIYSDSKPTNSPPMSPPGGSARFAQP